MIEANMTYLWQMPGGIDAKGLVVSGPGSPLQAQFEQIRTSANELSSVERAGTRHPSDVSAPNQWLSCSQTRNASLHFGISAGESLNHLNAGRDVTSPGPTFFVFEKHTPATRLSKTGRSGDSCFPRNCQ